MEEKTHLQDVHDWFLPAAITLAGTCVVYVFTTLEYRKSHISHRILLLLSTFFLCLIALQNIATRSDPFQKTVMYFQTATILCVTLRLFQTK